ncbi:uncharacterized protein GLRG_03505 [Colletotrichum graminicola M1.001]|uniref:Putative peptidase domain-containing protein n=1 Tax=Colletotrichum graminicola (strain M1.001 / M2 / FGSC 10212) TaxID=645133 RepID=E3QBM2_COLGM|nr:uncharacterized protein GLRG_03505 [Colletotrichum graminicola M1.001]EFQ28361.1 hypothetical protein GLRG_03505 [Colletotrichum graminicola M1.001]
MRFLGLLASLLAAWHVSADLEERDPSVNSFVFDSVFWVDRGDWKCTKQQVKQLNKAIDDARAVTQLAVSALSAQGSEDSYAFRTWFGQNWQFPKISKQKGNGVTENSLVYSCPPPGDKYCDPTSLAAARSQFPGTPWRGPTLVILCPGFFASKSTIESVAVDWKVAGKVMPTRNAGLTLVHEFQHMPKVTGLNNVCVDVPDPARGKSANGRPKGCYSPRWYVEYTCVGISDELKITNAENYAIFAGFIRAWPEKSKPARLPSRQIPTLRYTRT